MDSTNNKLQWIMKHVAEAQKVDVLVVCDATTKRLVSLAAMSIQRIEDIVNNKLSPVCGPSDRLEGESNSSPGSMKSPPASLQFCPPSKSGVSPPGVSSLPVFPSVGITPTSSVSWPLCLPSKTAELLPRNPQSASPLELAEKQNIQLMAAYKARICNVGKASFKSTDLSLGLQRRLAENLAIGKAREKALSKKRGERRVRLEAEAEKRFSASTGMSEAELERRQIYTRILEYEQDHKWLLPWREKMKEKMEDCQFIEQLVCQILGSKTHPLTLLMYSYQHKIYNKTHPLITRWQHARDKSRETVPRDESCNSNATSGESNKDNLSRNSSHTSSLTYDVSNFDDLFDVCISPRDSPRFDSKIDDSGVKKFDFSGGNSTTEVFDRKDDKSSHGSENGSCELQTEPGVNDQSDCSIMPESQNSSVRSDAEHGLTSLSSDKSLEELEREAIQRHLASISQDVQDLHERLLTMFIVAYEQLDNPTARDSCYSSLEEPFYRPIWGHILALYRVVNHKNEAVLAEIMSRYIQATPSDLRVPRKFCLLPEDSLLMPEGYQPYRDAIQEIQHISKLVTPLSKLEEIVQVSRTVCRCVEEFYANNKDEIPNIGADDLLPILSYAVIKSNLPQIMSECHALEDLVHEGYLMGEEGYCLTSLQTALRYVCTLLETS